MYVSITPPEWYRNVIFGSPGPWTKNSVALTTYRPKRHNFGLVCISSLGVCELALLVKLPDSRKLRQSRSIQVYVPPFWLCFLNFIPVDRAKFSHMNTPQNSSLYLSQPSYRAHMKRPLMKVLLA